MKRFAVHVRLEMMQNVQEQHLEQNLGHNCTQLFCSFEMGGHGLCRIFFNFTAKNTRESSQSDSASFLSCRVQVQYGHTQTHG